MKLPETQRIPVMAGDWPNPNDDLPPFGGRTVQTVQRSSARITIRADFSAIDPVIWGAIIGDPLAGLALAFRRINPHWYLEGPQE